MIIISVRGGWKETCENGNVIFKMGLQLLQYVGDFQYLHDDIMRFPQH